MNTDRAPVFIRADDRYINTRLIKDITRAVVNKVPTLRVKLITPNILREYPQGGIGYTNITNFLNSQMSTSPFLDLGSVVVNLDNIYNIIRVRELDENEKLKFGYRIKFITGCKEDDLVYYKGSDEYKILVVKYPF